jgi:ketosteroid isomerase-like protein
MQSWLANKLLGYTMGKLNAGDIKPTLRMDAADVQLTFPGDSSWSGVFRGKEQISAWLERFVRVGLQISADEVILTGFPWRQTLCIRGTDHLKGPNGERVYENRYVIWGHLAWGKLKDYEVYEDTQKATALDGWLAEHDPALLVRTAAG